MAATILRSTEPASVFADLTGFKTLLSYSSQLSRIWSTDIVGQEDQKTNRWQYSKRSSKSEEKKLAVQERLPDKNTRHVKQSHKS